MPLKACKTVTAWLLPRNKEISAYSIEFGSLYPTAAFIRSYENGDKRTEEQEFF